MCNNFPSGSALPGTGFSTHKRRQDKCGTGNSNGRSVAASQGTTRCSAPAETAAPARAGETCSSQSPGLIQADHRFSASLNRTHIPCRVGYSSVASRPWRWHSVAVCANSHSRRSICLTRNDIRRHPPRQIAVCAVAAADFVDRLASGASAGDYRFAIDHANDVQPAYLTVLTKTPLLAAPEY